MPAPIPYGGETLVNTTTTNDQKVSQVTALANGTYVVVWQDSSMAAPDNSFDAVRGQIFHADGTPLGSEFVLSEFPFAQQQDPVVTALPDGRFVAVWESFNHALGDQSGSHLSARIFNPDGTPSTGEFQVNTHTDFWQTKPAIATLDTGGFVITWMHDFQGGNVNYDIFARVFDANGQPVLDHDQGVDISTGVIERDPVVTGLPGGKFVIAWADDGSATQTDGSGSHIRAMIYTGANFQPLNGPSFVVNSTTVNNQSQPAIATLDNGNFVVSWTHQFSASDDDVRGRVFNGNGVAQSNDFGIDTSGNAVRESQSAITALPNGQYLDVWRDSGGVGRGQTDGSGSHIRGAVLSGNGSAVSGQFIINTTANGNQGEPAVARLADGRVVVTWTDFGLNGGDTSGAAVRSQILDPRTGPVTLADSGGNDEWVGTAFADTMNGGAGNDILRGGGDNDVLTGGAGADVLDGGAGTDRAQYDDAAAGLTVDLQQAVKNTGIAAGDSYLSIENLVGSTFDDSLRGDGADNSIQGGNGNDTLMGRDGNDSLLAGTGDDMLIGGLGGDVLDGGAGIDRALYKDATAGLVADLAQAANNTGIAAGDTYIAVENLQGSAFGDDLRGDAGTNTLWGMEGDDTLRGGGGNDSLLGGDGNDLLAGGDGNDKLSGEAGADTFLFDSALGAGNVDKIVGFSVADDTIQLDDAIFTAAGAVGKLGGGHFVVGPAALDATDCIIYNNLTGALSYDADGSGAGAAVKFASLDPGLALTRNDFYVV